MVYFFGFLGGLALFLYGMQLMGEGLQRAAGEKLQKILEKLTGYLPVAVALGAVVTGILQSSSATTVMTVGFVNAGLMNLKQAFGVVMGANIGTTMTAQLIAFKLTDYITLFLAIGFAVQLLAKRQRGKYIGQVVLGFGILMLGMEMMSNSVMPLREYQGFTDFIGRFSDNPVLGVAVGLVMTMVIQSSSATIGVLIAIANQGLIPLEGAIPVLLGDNIGTCITAVLASLRANITAKRVALAHVMFNFIGTIIFITFMGLFVKLVLAISPADDIARQIANAHTAFNVVNTLLFMPFTGIFIKLIEKMLPGQDAVISRKPVFLDDKMLATPSIAMGLAVKEIVRMGNMARHNVEVGLAALDDKDEAKIKYVLEHEPVIDALEEDITRYLTKMSEKEMGAELSAAHTRLLHACTDIERIGDHGEALAKDARRMFEDDVKFTEEAKEELRGLGKLVLEASGKAMEALANDDKALAQEAWDICRKVKKAQKQIRKNHIIRLNEKRCDPVAGFMMMEILINIKRVSDHSKNISQIVLGIF